MPQLGKAPEGFTHCPFCKDGKQWANPRANCRECGGVGLVAKKPEKDDLRDRLQTLEANKVVCESDYREGRTNHEQYMIRLNDVNDAINRHKERLREIAKG